MDRNGHSWPQSRGRTLYVHTPLCSIQVKRLQSPLLAKPFRLVNKLVSSIVASARISFGVFVYRCMFLATCRVCMSMRRRGSLHTLHHTSQSVEDGLGGKVLRGNQVDEVFLPVFLLCPATGSEACCAQVGMLEGSHLFNDVEDSGVGLAKVAGE
jgi:hypothetical protein